LRKLDPAKHEEKRLQILQAAGACFIRHGFQGASIAAICAEAGISPGHLYHYFDGKEAIIEAMTELGLQHAASRISEMAGKTNAVEALLSEIEQIHTKKDQKKDHPGPALVIEIVAEAGRNPAIGQTLHNHTQKLRGLLTDFLRDGQARGQIDPGLDPSSLATLLMGVIDGTKVMSVKDPDFDMAKTMGLVKLMFGRFLAPPPQA
jgi:TetR/AcrR family transcriptional repressor of uid operon